MVPHGPVDCFNGAATLSLRKWENRAPTNRSQNTCFNGAATLSLRKPGTAGRYAGLAQTASMGPQLYRCGNAKPGVLLLRLLVASMGPQLYRCGNASQLQPEPGRACALQWGRNFIVAETAPPLQSCSPPWQRFNGAATLSLRKQSGPSDALQLRIRLNGAATLSLRKRRPAA